ncbi:MAG TPA: exodeoxyribonuclease V subunit alpha [Burkholderiales bacterium]|nr:exodeoxyribonuclease V subunit alpha [Burkholderiales bacterium]
MSALQQALHSGLIGEADADFAAFLVAHSRVADERLALTLAELSRAAAQGHVCIDLAREDKALHGLLETSGLLANEAKAAPLVYEDGRLYLHRYWRYEKAVADDLRQRAQLMLPSADENLLDRYFQKQEEDGQRAAAALAVRRAFTLISGGPGTGKTTTVLRVLAILAEQAVQPLRMALAAPTGKAAARLQEALRLGRAALALPPAVDAQLPQEALTLHRLLGSIPGRTRFRHYRDHPLALDVLVVDEASMIDLALMAKLLDALPTHARLILLGDKDQLNSVEAGAVLSNLCAAGAHALKDNIVFLRHSYRFNAEGGIGMLAAAALSGDADKAMTVLAGNDETVQWSAEVAPAKLIATLADAYAPLFEAVRAGTQPQDALQLARRFAVLCAHREGLRGATGINAALEKEFRRRGWIDGSSPWYPGRLIMLNRNDYSRRLFNGDTGIVLRDEQGDLGVFIANAEGTPRRHAPARLPACETAFAMTVHKSQGSEFDEAAFILPQQSSPLLSRELFYTAVTRAARHIHVYGGEAVIRAAVAQRVERASGLGARLS